MNVDKKLLKHGMSVTCTIDGDKITDAKISINENGEIFICQNKRNGDEADNLLGYKYSWTIGTVNANYSDVNNLKIANRKIEDGLFEDDILVDEGDEVLVLGVCGKAIFISEHDNFKVACSSTRTLVELIAEGFKLKNQEEFIEVPEYTMEEAVAKMGHSFKIKK